MAGELVLVEPLLVSTDAELERSLDGLEPPLALDTEFHSEHRYYPRLMLVQVRDRAGRVVLIDALSQVDLRLLRRLDGVELIAHAPQQDLALLARRAGLRPGRVLDTQTLAGFVGLGYPRTLSDLCREVLGDPPGPHRTLSDWSRRPLDEAQLRYAIGDVARLHELADALLERCGPRRGWALQACAELAEQAVGEPPVEEAWRRIAAVEVLSERGRIVLERLAAWREAAARSQDQPRWQIASDASLVDLARRRPRDLDEMTSNRRFPKRLARRHAAALLALCIEPEGDPHFDHAARVRRAALERRLDAWAADHELRAGISARLALPPELRRQAVEAIQAQAAIPLFGWREAALKTELSRFVTGPKILKSLS